MIIQINEKIRVNITSRDYQLEKKKTPKEGKSMWQAVAFFVDLQPLLRRLIREEFSGRPETVDLGEYLKMYKAHHDRLEGMLNGFLG